MNTLSSTLVAAILVVISTTGITAASREQWITLYTGQYRNGSTFTFYNSMADLSTVSFSDKAKSVCGSGTWILYDRPQFNRRYPGSPYEVVKLKGGECTNLIHTPEIASSLGFAGFLNDHDADSFNLYEQINFGGDQDQLDKDVGRVRLGPNSQSLIITGRSAWTLYDLPDFKGSSRCLRPLVDNKVQSVLVPNFDLPPYEIPHSSIRSVRKGCHSEKLV